MRINFDSEYIEDVKLIIDNLLSLKSELNLYIDSKNFQKNEETPKHQINQNFYGNVGNLALGDINTYNTSIYLNALEKVIEDSDSIPPEEKKNLIEKIKDVAKNPYILTIFLF